jgi:predicted metal-dependent phosphoesterase TrpH
MDASPETLVDFHTHSHFSDGVLSPAALVERARTRNVGTLALTDHDTTAGLAEARAACVAAQIHFVPGVELSAQWRGARSQHGRHESQ